MHTCCIFCARSDAKSFRDLVLVRISIYLCWRFCSHRPSPGRLKPTLPVIPFVVENDSFPSLMDDRYNCMFHYRLSSIVIIVSLRDRLIALPLVLSRISHSCELGVISSDVRGCDYRSKAFFVHLSRCTSTESATHIFHDPRMSMISAWKLTSTTRNDRINVLNSRRRNLERRNSLTPESQPILFKLRRLQDAPQCCQKYQSQHGHAHQKGRDSLHDCDAAASGESRVLTWPQMPHSFQKQCPSELI